MNSSPASLRKRDIDTAYQPARKKQRTYADEDSRSFSADTPLTDVLNAHPHLLALSIGQFIDQFITSERTQSRKTRNPFAVIPTDVILNILQFFELEIGCTFRGSEKLNVNQLLDNPISFYFAVHKEVNNNNRPCSLLFPN